MKNSTQKSKIAAFCSIVMLLTVMLGSANLLLGNGKYIQITLKDKTVQKFEYDSFELNWISPQVIDQFSCDASDVDMGELVEVHVMSMNEYFCSNEQKEDRLFDVYTSKYINGVDGFIPLKKTNVSGKLFDTGELKTIPYDTIDRIAFFK